MPNQANLPSDKLKVYVKRKEKIVYLGKASAFTSRNKVGLFDVLPMHANFITLIYDFIVIDKGLASEKRIDLDNGVLFVRDNEVSVYVGI